MFKIGDTVIHPVHGFCSVKSIAQDKHLDMNDCVFILKLRKSLPGDLKILVPSNKIKESGIRYPVNKHKIPYILNVLENPQEKLITNNTKSYFTVKEKIRSGDIYRIAEVVRDLKKNNNAEVAQERNKLAQTAGNKLVNEIAYSVKISKDKAKDLVTKALKKRKGGNNAGK